MGRTINLIISMDLDAAEKDLTITITKEDAEKQLKQIVDGILAESPGAEKWLSVQWIYKEANALPEGDKNEKHETNI
jgi:hypothetical protein